MALRYYQSYLQIMHSLDMVNQITRSYLAPISTTKTFNARRSLSAVMYQETWLKSCMGIQLWDERQASSLHALDLSMALCMCTGQLRSLLLMSTACFAIKPGPSAASSFTCSPACAMLGLLLFDDATTSYVTCTKIHHDLDMIFNTI